MFMAFDHLLPHQTTGLALSCRRLLELTDEYFNGRLPHSKRANRGVALRWASKFRGLPPDQQSALETTVGVLPLLDVFAPLDRDIVKVYLSTAQAVSFMKKGEFRNAIASIENADEVALRTGLEVDVRTFRSHCCECQLKLAIRNVNRHARKGFYKQTLLWVKEAKRAASEAGGPAPDFTGVLKAFEEK
jgi:hypothetical protein